MVRSTAWCDSVIKKQIRF